MNAVTAFAARPRRLAPRFTLQLVFPSPRAQEEHRAGASITCPVISLVISLVVGAFVFLGVTEVVARRRRRRGRALSGPSMERR